jgi:hypothetical protein
MAANRMWYIQYHITVYRVSNLSCRACMYQALRFVRDTLNVSQTACIPSTIIPSTHSHVFSNELSL